MSLLHYIVTRKKIVAIFSILLMLCGMVAFYQLPRAADPPLVIRQALLMTPYPGANAYQVEKEVTAPIEKLLSQFEEVKMKKTTSISQPGMSFITITLHDKIKEPDVFWNKLRLQLATFKNQLPLNARESMLNTDFSTVVSTLISISSETKTIDELQSVADKLENQLRKIPQAWQIKQYGRQQKELLIHLDPEKLRQYRLSLSHVAAIIQSQNILLHSGTFTTNQLNIPFSADGRFVGKSFVEEILIFNGNDHAVRLRDIADINFQYVEHQPTIESKGKSCIVLAVAMQHGYNTLNFGRQIDRSLSDIKAIVSEDISIEKVIDEPAFVADTVNQFSVELTIAMITVFAILAFLLPFRIAVLAALSAPFSILLSLAAMRCIGITINQVSLAAIMIVFGALTDDAIVIADAYTERLSKGNTPYQAVIHATRKFFISIAIATACIIVTFLPMHFILDGLAGQLLQPLAPTIAIALTSSLIVSITVMPLLLQLVMPVLPTYKRQTRRTALVESLHRNYQETLGKLNRHWVMALAGAYSLVALALYFLATGPLEMFPDADTKQFTIEVDLRPGTASEKVSKTTRDIDSILHKQNGIIRTLVFNGTVAPRFHATYAPPMPASHRAQILVMTTGKSATKKLIVSLQHQLDKVDINARIRIRPLSYNQTAAPIEVRVLGEDLASMTKQASEVERFMSSTSGIRSTSILGSDKVLQATVLVDKPTASLKGISNATLSQYLVANIEGIPVSDITFNDNHYPLILKTSINPNLYQSMMEMYIPAVSGSFIPLTDFASIKMSWLPFNIPHIAGNRTFTVSGDLTKERTALDITYELYKKLSLSNAAMSNYEVAGAWQDVNENLPGLLTSFAITALLIFLIVFPLFGSIRKTAAVACSFPFILVGVAIGLRITSAPLGFMAIMGTIAVLGIAIRNAIILLEEIGNLESFNYQLPEATLKATIHRARPIILTCLSAALALLPMAFSGMALWGPFAASLCFGLLAYTMFTLTVFPVLLIRVSALRLKKRKLLLSTVTMLILCLSANGQKILTLEDCRSRALLYSYKHVAAVNSLRMSQANTSLLRHNYRPVVEANLTGYGIDNHIGKILPSQGLFTSVQLVQPLLLPTQQNIMREARLKQELSQTAVNLTASTVLQTAEQLYFELIALSEKKQAIKQTQKYMHELVTQALHFRDLGMISANAVKELEIQVARIQLDSLHTAGTCSHLRQSLSRMLDDNDWEIADSSFDKLLRDQPMPQETNPVKFPAIKPFDLQVEIEKNNYRLLRKYHSPTVAFVANGYVSQIAGQNALFTDQRWLGYLAGIRLSIPVSDFGRITYRKYLQSLRLRGAAIERKIQADNLQEQYNQLQIQIREAQAQLHLNEQLANLSFEQLCSAKDMQKAGVFNEQTVLFAVQNLIQAKSNIADSKRDLCILQSQLRYLTE
ncbi:efflux RND transporter permease subunit [Chitinophaga rhizophila]|uniref:Efflux RND transporter permease subunit n=1 Tax=Chitinophaga rhizophila TaxID=2866212 RepID=A0ABS7G7Q7_9BACT|nr:efflux RND transporter permease subunit [Chitinophaga rhizophila]MBW8683481.1 efflux RND transporter permease subunit [Chitinophaga rhizophila]